MNARLEAELERDLGMARSLSHQSQVVPEWGELAYAFLVNYAREHASFISEDVATEYARTTLPQVISPRAWGPVYQRAARAGIIAKDGYGTATSRHLSPCPRWRSRLAIHALQEAARG
jgi:hypothetical protein